MLRRKPIATHAVEPPKLCEGGGKAAPALVGSSGPSSALSGRRWRWPVKTLALAIDTSSTIERLTAARMS